MQPKIIAFELDNVIWSGRLDEDRIRKHPNALKIVEDNIEPENERVVRDKNDHGHRVTLFPDVPSIIHNIVSEGITIAIVSSNSSSALTNRALFYFKAPAANNSLKPIIEMVTFNEVGSGKVDAFRRIRGWSQAAYDEMLLFDSHASGLEVQKELGVNVKLLSKGLDWEAYRDALKRGSTDPYDTPFYALPSLGDFLGQGKFAKVYNSAQDSHAVVKVMGHWVKELRPRFLEIYRTIKQGKPFKPQQNNDDQYLLMIAFEIRNLNNIGELKAPEPEKFTGWFTMTKIGGIALWKTPLYRRHPFSVTFQTLVKTAFHLAVDEIEYVVQKHGVEHRDAHLGNVNFTMQGDWPVKGHLLDWGIAVLMKWDGKKYVRGNDVLVWADSEAGATYTPEEFRRYWIKWMVKTEYEANMSRGAITEKDGREFLKDLDWWYQR